MRILGLAMIIAGTFFNQRYDNKIIKFISIIGVISGVYVQNWNRWYV